MNTADDHREIELASQPLDADDHEILSGLHDWFTEHDPLPDNLIDKIKFELTLEALRTEVAQLVQMETVDSGVRTAATESVRTITFTSESLTTMVTITPQADSTVRVDGWATPGAGLTVRALQADAITETVADDDGRFALEHLKAGLTKFELSVPRGEERFPLDGGVTVTSPTIEL